MQGLPRGVRLHLRLLQRPAAFCSAGFAGIAVGTMRASWMRALLLQLLLAGLGGCLSRQELFPFGPGQGDLELEDGDDLVSPALELTEALRFYDRSDIESVYVSATQGGQAQGGVAGRHRKEGGHVGDTRGVARAWVSRAQSLTAGLTPTGFPPLPGPPKATRRRVSVTQGSLAKSARPRAPCWNAGSLTAPESRAEFPPRGLYKSGPLLACGRCLLVARTRPKSGLGAGAKPPRENVPSYRARKDSRSWLSARRI